MNETIPSASDLETYDEDITELSREKRRLEFRLRLLQTGNVGPGRLIYLFGVIFLLFTIYGILTFLYPPGYNADLSNSGFYTFAMSAPALSFIFYLIIKRRNNKAFDRTASRLYEIEREIYEEQEKENQYNMKEKQLLQKT